MSERNLCNYQAGTRPEIQSDLVESCCTTRATFQSNQLDVRQPLQWLVMLISLITSVQNFICMRKKKRRRK